jgi:ABC-2 type transport system permease protein
MNTHVLFAVFRRNFVSYFVNPTGYLFICAFVFFAAVAAFCVREFFGNNLANLDQLSYWFPYIMLVYIPTITMGIWAEERKQGTDELLLTIPATDFDIVLGKFLAALAIFTVALVFSLLCNYLILNNLASSDVAIALKPNLDLGLFLGTYAGYWLVGLAMLSIGLVASFLASNITISFVLGVLFNIPLVFLIWADAIFGGASEQGIQSIASWSIGQQMLDFTRGVLSLAGVLYFLMILAVMLYASMALIGRRHWFSGQHRWLQVGHFLVRGLALVVVAVGMVVLFRNHDLRYDVTSERLSSLSKETRELIGKLDTKRPVRIEAFISPTVPEEYVQPRLNLLATLKELQSLGGKNVDVRIHNTDLHGDDADLAQKRYGIEPRQIASVSRGALEVKKIFMNVAVNCGSQKVPPIFIDRDTPAEYELVRSICTVTQQKRKRLGLVNTDAQLYGSFNMQTMSPAPNWPIIDALEKQYEVVRVDPSKAITEKYDVLLAVQPSTLGPEEMNNFIAAVAAGQPTAIFEDPAPVMSEVAATSMPRQAGGGNPMMRMQAPPKGDINRLWNLLGIDFPDKKVAWQDFNPYPKFTEFRKGKEFVFADTASGAKEAFSAADPISSGLQQVLFPFPGIIVKRNDTSADLKFTPLATTNEKTGTVDYADLMQMDPFRGPRLNPGRNQAPTGETYVLSAHIQGKVELSPPIDEPFKNPEGSAAQRKPIRGTVNVVLTSDVDMFSQPVFALRERGEIPEIGVHFRLDNVAFLLNILDSLADDSRFLEVRKRRPAHHILARIDEKTKGPKQEAAEAREEFRKKYEEEKKAQEDAIRKKLAELQKQKDLDVTQLGIQLGMMSEKLERERQATIAKLEREKDREDNRIEKTLNSAVEQVQTRYKLLAVLLPPILPLLVALIVLIIRRTREREGVAKSRLR